MDDEPMQYSYTQLSIRPSLGHLRLQKCMMVMAEMLMSKLQNGGSRISKLPHGYPLVWSFIYLCLYLSAGDTIWIFVIKRTKILFVVKVKQAEKKNIRKGFWEPLPSWKVTVIMIMSVFYVPLRQLPPSKFIVIYKMNSTQHWPIESLNKWLN